MYFMFVFLKYYFRYFSFFWGGDGGVTWTKWTFTVSASIKEWCQNRHSNPNFTTPKFDGHHYTIHLVLYIKPSICWNCSFSVLWVFFTEQTLHFFFRLPNVPAGRHVFYYFLKIVREIIQIITRLQMGIPFVVFTRGVDIAVASMGHNGSERGT